MVDINHLVETMKHVVDNPGEAKEKAEVAYKYVMDNLTWEHSIVPKWVNLFNEASSMFNIPPAIDSKNIFKPVSI
jgi:hypothetical protein